MCGRKIKNKINAYIYSKCGINKCVNALYCNLCTISEHHCQVERLKNKKFQKK